MEALARHIGYELQLGEHEHCAVCENELQRLWPLHEKDREAKIAQFAKEYGFRLRYYNKGLCSIFDKSPLEDSPWKRNENQREFLAFTRRLIQFEKEHPVFRRAD
jgi:hypothetical protein